MIETESLILDKAKFSDWKEMYYNVWSQPESAKYMSWSITTNEDDAKIRMIKTIAFQKEHDTYLVYERASGKAIGFAGVEKIGPCTYQEAGICLGPNYVRKGFGKQILRGLIQYCKKEFDAKEFIYSTREENRASNLLAESFGFSMISTVTEIDGKDGHRYNLLQYSLKL
ncbi:MAG: GNAT family N-acetyltransferase [Emergencia sp.]|jgi:RimJ/RimL family protein N-acetyltransferase|uniref:GNAT family N-acetyltransferase n=1 Tax=unclassified Emergencia TaxID=2642996 RepID=UPI00137B5DDE|nr:GNAT family N-acetyltransferase [Emergencia sp. 1XD21-10]MCI9475716.1 GNAT family N-acetyltransferase [Emergencia sp.]MCI9638832.1 GNAT family N-acetyltransferase [Emergencia sp.]NCE97625.1 N-acetyltransferase [Emergencia sp. 1XD21-10]